LFPALSAFRRKRIVPSAWLLDCERHPGSGILPTRQHAFPLTAAVQMLSEATMMLRLLLLIIVIMMLVGSLPSWPYSTGWGYYPSGGLGTILVILLILMLLGRI